MLTKILALTAFIFFMQTAGAQHSVRILQATSTRARIIEGDDELYRWGVNPRVQPDTHVISKNPHAQRVRFYTDIDSFETRLRPGQSADFIVLLNGHDSCHTRLQILPLENYAGAPERHDTLPFTLTPHSNLSFRAVVNGDDSVWIAFDSGSTGLLLTDSTLKGLKDINTDSSTNSLALGGLAWKAIPVYPVERTPHGMTGVFGWDFFDGRIVEIDYDKKLFIVHTRMRRTQKKGYTSFPIEYKRGLLCIKAALVKAGKPYDGRFLYDDGYERTVLLDTSLLAGEGVLPNFPVLKKAILHNERGKEIPVFTVLLEALRFGHFQLDSIPAQLLAAGNQASFKTHILGAEVLKRFNAILDFQHNRIYLRPSTLSKALYTERYA